MTLLTGCYEFESHDCLCHFILSRQYFIGMTDQVQSVQSVNGCGGEMRIHLMTVLLNHDDASGLL